MVVQSGQPVPVAKGKGQTTGNQAATMARRQHDQGSAESKDDEEEQFEVTDNYGKRIENGNDEAQV